MLTKIKNIFKIEGKKGEGGVFGNLAAVATGLLTLGLVLGITFVMTAQVASNDQISANGNATAALSTVDGALDDIPGWLGLIVLAFVGVIIFGLVRMFRN